MKRDDEDLDEFGLADAPSSAPPVYCVSQGYPLDLHAWLVREAQDASSVRVLYDGKILFSVSKNTGTLDNFLRVATRIVFYCQDECHVKARTVKCLVCVYVAGVLNKTLPLEFMPGQL